MQIEDLDVIFAVGSNSNGEFGLNHNTILEQLTQIPHKLIDKIYCGSNYCIYAHNQQFWCAGSNTEGACGLHMPDTDIIHLTELKYFNIHNINITKVCINVSGSTTFWIDRNRRVYGHGNNTTANLATKFNQNSNNANIFSPHLIPALDNVIDIVSAGKYSIALCAMNNDICNIIIQYWSNMILSYTIPNDIIKLIEMFVEETKVYATSFSEYGGTGLGTAHNYDDVPVAEWEQIEFLNDKHIIKIATGLFHSCFLDSNGALYTCGGNALGQCGLGHIGEVDVPAENNFFKDNNIIIKDIKCGCNHSLALDYNGNVYSWGFNSVCECGHGNANEMRTPTLIETLNDYEIVEIKCGYNHSYCKSKNGKHFLFGGNEYNHCLTYDDKPVISLPYCINDIVKEKCGKLIKSVILGCDLTFIIV
eukprot:44227_1